MLDTFWRYICSYNNFISQKLKSLEQIDFIVKKEIELGISILGKELRYSDPVLIRDQKRASGSSIRYKFPNNLRFLQSMDKTLVFLERKYSNYAYNLSENIQWSAFGIFELTFSTKVNIPTAPGVVPTINSQVPINNQVPSTKDYSFRVRLEDIHLDSSTGLIELDLVLINNDGSDLKLDNIIKMNELGKKILNWCRDEKYFIPDPKDGSRFKELRSFVKYREDWRYHPNIQKELFEPLVEYKINLKDPITDKVHVISYGTNLTKNENIESRSSLSEYNCHSFSICSDADLKELESNYKMIVMEVVDTISTEVNERISKLKIN